MSYLFATTLCYLSNMTMVPNASVGMERYFVPTARYRDLIHIQEPNHRLKDNDIAEGQLTSTLEEFSISISDSDLKWEDLHALVSSKIVWMTPTAFLRSHPTRYDDSICPRMLCISDMYSGSKIYVFAQGPGQAVRVADCLMLLLAKSDKPDVSIKSLCNPQMRPCSGFGLQQFLTRTRSTLRKITMDGLMLEQGHCRALTHAYAHEPSPDGTDTDVEVKLFQCSLTGDDYCNSAFIDWMHSDRGPSLLFRCDIACHVLADGLMGNRRLKKLILSRECLEENLACKVVAQALTANLGLVKLYFGRQTLNAEHWNLLVRSLASHPSLEVLDLGGTRERQSRQELTSGGTPVDRKARRTSAVGDMLKSNTVIHTVSLSDADLHRDIFEESIQPWLEMNLFWPRIMSIKGTVGPLREKVLGQALRKVRHNPNRMWMILSGNGDVLANVARATSRMEGVVRSTDINF
jgi:hypothetical protein